MHTVLKKGHIKMKEQHVGWLQKLSERYYAPYLKWAYSPKGILISSLIAIAFVLLAYLFKI
jgi:hypothetical protein